MAQHLNITVNLAAAAFAAVFILSAIAALSTSAEARTPQTYPAISLETPLARDADTFNADRTLEAACRQAGQDKAVCLCVTHILKYELTLSEYRAATRLYGQAKIRTDLHNVLKTEGFTPADIRIAEDMERSLAQDRDFAPRCSEAKAYYKTRKN